MNYSIATTRRATDTLPILIIRLKACTRKGQLKGTRWGQTTHVGTARDLTNLRTPPILVLLVVCCTVPQGKLFYTYEQIYILMKTSWQPIVLWQEPNVRMRPLVRTAFDDDDANGSPRWLACCSNCANNHVSKMIATASYLTINSVDWFYIVDIVLFYSACNFSHRSW